MPGTEDKYVAFFNTSHAGTSDISVKFTELGVSGNYSVKELWSKEEKGKTILKFTVPVDPHASVIVRFSKVE